MTPSTTAATFSAGVEIPELTFVIFQLTFAAITPALIIGAIAERMKFGAVMLFLAIWFTFSYLPIAHMVWWFGGGYLFGLGAYDFAGGTVVHINAGVAGLVAAIFLGKRKEFLKEPIPPHNLTFTFIGACLLWVGWFGFNAGSNLEATGLAAQATLNTITAPAAAALAWAIGEKFSRGHASLLGAASGAVAGLVAITPAAGFAGSMGAIVLGAVAGVVCLWAVVTLKPMFKYDDALDVFGVHGVGGIVGALGTAIVAAPSLGGFALGDPAAYSIGSQFLIQLQAVVIAVVWSGVVTAVAMLIVKAVFGGARVSESAEADGLDLSSHGEHAYNACTIQLRLEGGRASFRREDGDLLPVQSSTRHQQGSPAVGRPSLRPLRPRRAVQCSSWPATEASHSQTAWAAHPGRTSVAGQAPACRTAARPAPARWAGRWCFADFVAACCRGCAGRSDRCRSYKSLICRARFRRCIWHDP